MSLPPGGARLVWPRYATPGDVFIADAKAARWQPYLSITGKRSTTAARNWTLPTWNHSAEIAMNPTTAERRAKNNKNGRNIFRTCEKRSNDIGEKPR